MQKNTNHLFTPYSEYALSAAREVMRAVETTALNNPHSHIHTNPVVYKKTIKNKGLLVVAKTVLKKKSNVHLFQKFTSLKKCKTHKTQQIPH
jgi:hypothetical protein